jgi:hypothetical protein
MQQINVQVGPYAAADANGISLSQTVEAGGYAVLNGALGSFSAVNIAAAQTPAGAGNLTLTSTTVPLNPEKYVYITTVDDETARTFTVYGTDRNGTSVVEAIAGVDAETVSSTKKFAVITRIAVDNATADDVTVGSYSVAALSPAGRITITSAGDESGNTFTISGTNWSGIPISEILTGANIGAVTSVMDYKTITSIVAEDATADAIEVGTAQSGGSRWVRLDGWAFAQVGLQVDVDGTIDYTVQQTFDDPSAAVLPVSPEAVTWIDSADTAVVTETASKQSSYAYAPTFVRVVANSGAGSAVLRVTQYGNVPL